MQIGVMRNLLMVVYTTMNERVPCYFKPWEYCNPDCRNFELSENSFEVFSNKDGWTSEQLTVYWKFIKSAEERYELSVGRLLRNPSDAQDCLNFRKEKSQSIEQDL